MEFVGTPTGLTWSRDGRRLAVVVALSDAPGPSPNQSPDGLWVMNVDGSNARLVSGEASGPSVWDPSGHEIAFLVGGVGKASTMTIDTVPATGGRAKVVATVPNAPWDWVSLSWSPNGKTILFTEENARLVTRSATLEVLAIPADGGRAKRSSSLMRATGSAERSTRRTARRLRCRKCAGRLSCRFHGPVTVGLVIANAAFTQFHGVGSSEISKSPCPLPPEQVVSPSLRVEGVVEWVEASAS